MNKVLETLFRHKLLLLLPPFLITVIVTPLAIITAPMSYESYAGIWVDRPTYLTYTDDWNRYITPSQNQSSRLTELLKTRTFLDDIASRTSLSSLVNTPRGEDRIDRVINGGMSVFTSGTHLLVVRFRGDTPQLTYQVLGALVDAFNENAANDRVNQSSLAISFYEQRLQAAQDEQDKATDALRQYLAANPKLADQMGRQADSPNGGVPGVLDPQLQVLQRNVQSKQDDLERQRVTLDQARFDASAAIEGQQLGFQVVDAPQMPTSGGRDLRRRIVFPAAGLAVGLGLSAVLLVLLMAGDRSVRSEAELAPGMRVLAVVPRFALKRSLRKRLGAEGARRATGFVAGTALPAPGGTR